MKYMFLAYDDFAAWEQAGEAALRAAMQEAVALTHELDAKGQYVLASPLQPPSTATSVRVKNGKPLVTDGPFVETREHLGGFYIIEAANLDEAIAIAARHPGNRHGGLEIRPILELEGLPEPRLARTGHTATNIFVNLPVENLPKSMDFFKALGYSFNPQFTDDTAACMIVSDTIYVMLLTKQKFQQFTPKAVCDATKSSEVLVALSCSSREAVQDLVKKAVAAGGSTYAEPKDYGFMYQHGYQDLDGHIWELVYMDPAAMQK